MRTHKRRALILVFCLIALTLVLMLWLRQTRLYRVTVLPSLGGDFMLPCAVNERG